MAKTDKDMKEQTFKQVAEQWLDNIKGSVAATTFDRYQDALNRDVYPEYADKPMKVMTVREMNRFLKNAPDIARGKGRTAKRGSVLVLKAVLGGIIQYAEGGVDDDGGIEPADIRAYEELTTAELEKMVLHARFNQSFEMLAALLSLYCGMRVGEICALSCDDVDFDRMEIYIHRIAHRVKNPDKDALKKTVIVVEELPRKNQIRTAEIPGVLREYIEDFMIPGRFLVRNADDGLMDMRTLEYRLDRILQTFHMKGINFERCRKTFMKGNADVNILNNIFLGNRPDRPYAGTVDKGWLTDEMKRDLMPLRVLIGLSEDEMRNILGVPESVYKRIEAGDMEISWDQYMTMLFVFHYNGRTMGVVDSLGLFPESLKNYLDI